VLAQLWIVEFQFIRAFQLLLGVVYAFTGNSEPFFLVFRI